MSALIETVDRKLDQLWTLTTACTFDGRLGRLLGRTFIGVLYAILDVGLVTLINGDLL